MIEEFATRLIAGFTPATLILLTLVSIVAALVMRRWSQLSAAALFAFAVDCVARYLLELGAADGVPVNFAMELAMNCVGVGTAIRTWGENRIFVCYDCSGKSVISH